MRFDRATHETEMSQSSNSRDSRRPADVTRRRFLAGSAAGVAGLGALGSAGSAAAVTGEHTLIIEGFGSPTSYSFTVGENLGKSTANGASINRSDEIIDRSAHGQVVAGKDAYTFDGPLYSFDFDTSNRINVTLDGEPAHVGRRPDHTLLIEGFGPNVPYSFTATTNPVPSEAYGASVNNDTTTRSGYGSVGSVVGGGKDAYTYFGDLQSFDFDRSGEIRVTIDGKAAHVGRRPDRKLTIVATGEYTPYEFNVSGAIRESINTENGQDSAGTVGASGVVTGSGYDQYTFDGKLTALTYPEDTSPEVYSNHERVNRTNY